MKSSHIAGMLLTIAALGCKSNPNKPGETISTVKPTAVIRGLYSFGPEVKSFKDCADGHEYWVADSSAKLELSYSQQNFEKPYEPVYVELEGQKVKSGTDGTGAEFDSTLVVKKLIKLTKELPKDCN